MYIEPAPKQSFALEENTLYALLIVVGVYAIFSFYREIKERSAYKRSQAALSSSFESAKEQIKVGKGRSN